MTKLRWFVVASVAAGTVYSARGCLNSSDPDERLGSRFEKLCGIARDNVDTPEAGVRKIGRYLGSHADDMFGEFGGTIALIERIDDDDAHDERAYLARQRLVQPWVECRHDWNQFLDAVEADPEASALVQSKVERLSRTLEIIFSGADLRAIPAQIQRKLDEKLR
jgi:hypothetical protein